ncbi:nucleoside-triphosphatase THEP1 isoform X2 [Zeugodacus cucurbitae]|nr:nucleoside-triphosphatase THEP1 isoform X2 [Zeugodacus cucurbitae]
MDLEHKHNIILLTGLPGVGKTTLLRKICDEVRVINSCQGFLTEEVRDKQSRKRIGFDAVSMSGQRCVLARDRAEKNKQMPMMGKYYIYIDDFENLVLPLIACANSKFELLVIDEIGKMELKSKKFESALYELIHKVPILATIPCTVIKDSKLIEYIKKTPKSIIYEINKNNRDVIQKDVVTCINNMLKNN